MDSKFENYWILIEELIRIKKSNLRLESKSENEILVKKKIWFKIKRFVKVLYFIKFL